MIAWRQKCIKERTTPYMMASPVLGPFLSFKPTPIDFWRLPLRKIQNLFQWKKRCSISDCSLRKACGTGAATYSHATHAFQAYRGDCFCFSGSLVCAKPNPGGVSFRFCRVLLNSYQNILAHINLNGNDWVRFLSQSHKPEKCNWIWNY